MPDSQPGVIYVLEAGRRMEIYELDDKFCSLLEKVECAKALLHRANAQCRKGQSAFIYLMRSDNQGAYKIGRSANPANRASALRAAFGDMQIIHLVKTDDGDLAERYFHFAFMEFRIEGEWFALQEGSAVCFQTFDVLNREEIIEKLKQYIVDTERFIESVRKRIARPLRLLARGGHMHIEYLD